MDYRWDTTLGGDPGRACLLFESALHQYELIVSGAPSFDRAASPVAWESLLEGHWTLVEPVDDDEGGLRCQRYFVAIPSRPERARWHRLSTQERRSADALGLGASTKAIADELGVSEAAVSAHLSTVRRKLRLGSRTELAAFFSPTGVRGRLVRLLIDGMSLLFGAYPLCHPAAIERLTRSERAVMALLLRGASNANIAQRRQTSLRTIANQVQSIFRKLGVASRVELAVAVAGEPATPGAASFRLC